MRARTRRRRRRRRARCSRKWWTRRRGSPTTATSSATSSATTAASPPPSHPGATGRGAAVHRGGEGDGQLRPRERHRRHGAVGLRGAVARLGSVRRAGSGTALTPHTLPCMYRCCGSSFWSSGRTWWATRCSARCARGHGMAVQAHVRRLLRLTRPRLPITHCRCRRS